MENKKILINENESFLIKSEIKIYRNLLPNIGTCKETQNKWMLVMRDKGKIKELEILFIIITESINEELQNDQKGVAYYLVGIFMHCLNSYEFWHKLVLIVGSDRYKKTREALKDVIKIKCIYRKIMDTIEIYFNSLDCVDNEYFVSEEKIPENFDNQELLKNVKFNHISLIINFLLNHHELGTQTADALFVFGSYEEDFLKYLKDFIRNYSVM